MNGKIVNSEEHSKKCSSLDFTSRKKEDVTKQVVGGTVMLYEERVLTCKECGFKTHISLKYKSEKENLKKDLEKDFKYAVFLLRQTKDLNKKTLNDFNEIERKSLPIFKNFDTSEEEIRGLIIQLETFSLSVLRKSKLKLDPSSFRKNRVKLRGELR